MPDPQKIEEADEPFTVEELRDLELMFADFKGKAECCPISGDAVHRLIRGHIALLTAYVERGKALRASALALDSADHFAKEMLETFQDSYLIEGKRHPGVDPEELADIDQAESLISDIEAARRAAALAGGRE